MKINERPVTSRRHHHNHHHHRLATKKLGHMLTWSVPTHPGVSLMVSPRFFCLLVCSFVIILIYLLRGILFVYFNQFLLYSCILSKTNVKQPVCLFYNLSKFILLYISFLLLLFLLRLIL